MSLPRRLIDVLFKQKEFFYVSAANFVMVGIGALFWFVLARLFSVSSYGEVGQLLFAGQLAGTVATIGLDITIMSYFPKERDEHLLEQACLTTGILGVAAALSLVLFNMALLAPLTIAMVAFAMTMAIELGRRDYKRYFYVVAVSSSLKLVLVVLLSFLLGATGVILGYTLAILAVSYDYLRSLRPSLNFTKVRDKLNFALHGFSFKTMGLILGQVDKVLVPALFGAFTAGLYLLAFQFYMAFSAIPLSLFSYLLPEEASGTKRREVEILGLLAAVGAMIFGIVASPIMIGILFPKFVEGTMGVQIASLAVIPTTIAYVKSAKYFGEERPRRVSIAYILALFVELIGIIILGNLFGLVGLVLVLALTWTFMTIILLI